MVLKLARRGNIPPFIVMDVMRAANARAAAGGDVLHLEVGQPATGAPAKVVAAAHAALEGDRLGYTDAFGLPALRERIASHYRSYYGVAVDPERVVVTVGSSGAFLLAFTAAFEAGDRVALVAPGYPAYRNILMALGVEPVLLEAGPEHRFQPNVALLDAIEGRLDGLILASPSNPTGSMLDAEGLAAVAGWCRARGVRLISDEIYHGITFGERACTMLACDDEAIIVNSFSKYFSMTGWRLGWMILPPDLLRGVECLQQNMFISAPTLSQRAAVAVFDCQDELDANVARYAESRAMLLDSLPKAGFEKLAPSDGAFYLYADISERTDDSDAFCRRMLAETGVAATPGIDFDPLRGRTSMRFCFAGMPSDIAEAVRRLRAWR